MRPPAHRIDADAVLVLPTDPAWDHDRITRELEDLGEDDPHPVRDYLRGRTRYDLGARVGGASASDYLTGTPARFKLRRLSISQRAELEDKLFREAQVHGEAASYSSLWLQACRWGLRDIEGLSGIYLTRSGDQVSEETLRDLFDHYGGLPAGISQIGIAVWRLSEPLRDDEKKR